MENQNTKIETTYYENGSIATETSYMNEKMHGTYKTFFETGILSTEEEYVNGLINGVEKEYHEDGSLLSTTKYKNGVLDGYKHCSDGRMGNESLNCR